MRIIKSFTIFTRVTQNISKSASTSALIVMFISAIFSLTACQQSHLSELGSTASLTDNSEVDYLNRDVRDDVFYFVLPDRFNNGDASNDNGSLAQGISHGGFNPTSERGFHGGDIKGIEQKLDYLQSLGITAIWMTPLLRNKAIQNDGIAHHGYWIVDFTEVDPHFGSNDDLKQLINAAHKKGMKVFFDIITNHTADVIKYQQCHESDGRFKTDFDHCEYQSLASLTEDVAYRPFIPEAEKNAKVPSWLNDPQYYHNQGDSTFEGESSLNGDFNGLDDLNTADPRVLTGMVEIYQKLIKEFKPDGFRIDTVKHVDLSFWRTFSPAIINHAKAEGIPNFHIFGEVYDPDPKALSVFTTEGKLPSVLDFAFQDVAANIFYRGKSPLLAQALFEQDRLYKDHDSQADLLMTFLGNHDMGRTGYFINQHIDDVKQKTDFVIENKPLKSERLQREQLANEKLQRSILSHAFMFLSRGIPVVYYGDEQGFTGDGNDIYAREDMFASKVKSYNDNQLLGTEQTTAVDNFDTAHPLYIAIGQLSKLRKQHRALRRGEYQDRFYHQDSQMFAFARIDEVTNKELLVVFNTASSEQEIHFEAANGQYIPVVNTGKLTQTSTLQGSEQVSQKDHQLHITLPRFSYAVYDVIKN